MKQEILSNIEGTIEQAIPNNNGLINKILHFSFGPFSTADIIQIVLAIIICRILLKYLVNAIFRILNKTKVDEGLTGFIISILRGIIYIITTIVIMDALGLPVTQMVALISVLGLAISLSIQNFMSNLMSGLTILATKPYKIGDYIETKSGGSGIVQKIGLLYTEILSIDEKFIFIPNGLMASNQITNYSKSDTRKIDFILGVDYNSDIENVKRVVLEIINKDARVLKSPEPIVRLKSFDESSLGIRIRCTVKTIEYMDILYDLNENILKKFREEKINIPYPHMDINIIGNKKDG